jgi:uncharacterized ferritin-like protein (DUF455 family)
MTLQAWADHILRTSEIDEKLAPPGALVDDPRPRPTPSQPGRPASLAFSEARAAFPAHLAAPQDRARALHFFANHELLAIELMALALLRFHDAPAAWRRALARILQDEQRHFRLYRDRVRALGLDVGAVPVHGNFWQTLAPIDDRERFVAAMALTFEQANLDHCVHYAAAFDAVGDAESAALMREVHRDEIGHVAHGVAWADAGDDLWRWWTERLVPPLTPARARGQTFDREGRRRAGLGADVIDRLEVYAHASGRSPDVWAFHPHHEGALRGHSPSRATERLTRDLGALMLFPARAEDVVCVTRVPSTAFLQTLRRAGVSLARCVPLDAPPDVPRVDRVRPWGEDPAIAQQLAPWSRLARHPCRPSPARRVLASKVFAFELLQATFGDEPGLIPPASRGRICRTADEVADALAQWPDAVVKAPWSTAGRDRARGLAPAWLTRTLREQGAVCVQPWWERVADVSVQARIEDDDDQGARLHVDGVTRFHTDATGRFLGVEVGHPWQGLPPEVRRFCAQARLDDALRRSAEAFAARAAPLGFRGPFGVDAMIVREGGELRALPLLEVNARCTMGRIAWSLHRHVARGVPATWSLFRRADLARWGFRDDAEFLAWVDAHPLQRRADGAWIGGALLTTEWHPDAEVGSWLRMGDLTAPRPPR